MSYGKSLIAHVPPLEFAKDIYIPLQNSIPTGGNVRNVLQYSLGSRSDTVEAVNNTQAKIYIPLEWLYEIPHAAMGSLRLQLRSYRTDTDALLGEDSTIRNIPVPDFVLPNIQMLRCYPVNQAVPPGMGYFTKLSKLGYVVNAQGAYGSAVKRYTVKIGDIVKTTPSGTTEALDRSGEWKIEITVSDTRNRSVTTESTIQVQEYEYPSASNIRWQRCNSAGESMHNGEYARLTGDTFVAQGFTKTLRVTVDGEEKQGVNGIYGIFPLESSHRIALHVSDGYFSSEYMYTLESGECILHVTQHSAAFGGYGDEANTFEVFWNLGRRLKEKILALISAQSPGKRYMEITVPPFTELYSYALSGITASDLVTFDLYYDDNYGTAKRNTAS